MTLFQEILLVVATACLLYALVVTGILSWLLFVKRRTLFHDMRDIFHDQLARVDKKLKERE